MDLHALVAERLGEGVVFLARLLGPEHVVEEQALDVRGRQSRKFETGPVQYRLLELAHFGIYVECHYGTSLLPSWAHCPIRLTTVFGLNLFGGHEFGVP